MRPATFGLTLLLAGAAATLQGCALGIGAGAVAGVAAAHDRRTAGTLVDDQLIEFKVYDGIRTDAELWEQSHINVTSFNNVVLLTGEAPAESLRTRAAELARRVTKVRAVHNELTVAAPSSMLSRSGDSWITGKVKTSLLAEKNIDATRVKVVTENGVVYLMGLLTRAEADAATGIARKVQGVQRVVKVFEYTD